MEEVIERLKRVEQKQDETASVLHSHIREEAEEFDRQSREHRSKLDEVSHRLYSVEVHLSRQKGFVAGALFVLSALSYVLVEAFRKLIGTP